MRRMRTKLRPRGCHCWPMVPVMVNLGLVLGCTWVNIGFVLWHWTTFIIMRDTGFIIRKMGFVVGLRWISWWFVIWQGGSWHGKKLWGGCCWWWWRNCVKRRRCGSRIIALISHHGNSILSMDLEMFSKWGWMGVGLVASTNPASVWFVSGVNMHVLFSVTRVGKSSVTSLDFTLKWLFS